MKTVNLKSLLAGACLTVFATLSPVNAQLKPIPPPPAGQPALLPSEVVIISRFGVSPAKTTRPTGPFVLFVENRLAPHEEVLTLVREGSTASLLQLTTERNRPRDSAALNPETGTYHLQFRNNTQFTVEIEITN